jgi:uncharacterized MnhB-related membrane protein
MTRTSTALIRLAIATGIGGAALLWSGQLPLDSPLVSPAEARVGRPLTPVSYAGVARRTTRRAVAVGAAGATAAGAYYAAPSCRQVADAYGRLVTVC